MRQELLSRVGDADVQHGRRLELNHQLGQAAQWYTLAARRGVPAAQWAIGDLYWYGRGVPRDASAAVAWYQAAAKSRYPRAQASLGHAYQLGRGIKQDANAAIALYRISARGQDALGEYLLGLAYDDGFGTANDDAKASEWLKLAADQGNPRAQSLLGSLYRYGMGVNQDVPQGLALYRKAIAYGYPVAMANLGYAYRLGLGVPQDEREAASWYRRAFDAYKRAALAGDPEMQNRLASMYYGGLGTAKDYRAAFGWFSRAATAGNVDAQQYLAVFYSSGLGHVQKSGKLALHWARASAEQGYARGSAFLGLCYLICGRPVRNVCQSIEWLSRARDVGSIDAYVQLGELYEDPHASRVARTDAGRCGLSKDPERGLMYLQHAAKLGSADAAIDLGNWYWGSSGGHDCARSMHWYREAADRGSAEAMDILGRAYANVNDDHCGKIVRGNAHDPLETTFRLWERAARTGDAWAEYAVAYSYDVGQGIAISKRAAASWFLKAAAAGSVPAQYYVGLLYQHGSYTPLDYVQSAKWLILAAALRPQDKALAGKARRDRDAVLSRLDDDHYCAAARAALDWASQNGYNARGAEAIESLSKGCDPKALRHGLQNVVLRSETGNAVPTPRMPF